jgi:DNA invertase Pin-like site-specific DNA recombinase
MSLIYFMRRADGVGPIKIGCSKIPASRLQAHQVWSPEKLEIIAAVPGGFADEKRIHRQFDDYRLHGEWFEASPLVLAFMTRAAAAGALPPPPAEDKILRMEDMYRAGRTLQEIGDEFGVTRERVRQLLRKAGVPTLGWRPEVVRKTVTPLLEAKIVLLGKRGLTVPDIAQQTGLPRQSVRTYLAANDVKVPRAKLQRRPQTIEKAFSIAADYRAGLKVAEIAVKHGVDAPHIFRLIRIAGVKPARMKRASELPAEQIVELYSNGATLQEVADKFGASVTAVRARVQRAGALRSAEQNELLRLERVRAANARRRAA